MKKTVFAKILCALGVSAIVACIIFETMAIIYGEKNGAAVPAAAGEDAVFNISGEEKLLLARFVTAQTGDRPFLCRVAVAAVIFNRMRSPKYPSSLTEVIWQLEASESTSGEAHNTDEKLLAASINAVEIARSGEDPTNGALNYHHRSDVEDKNADVLFYIGDIVFTP